VTEITAVRTCDLCKDRVLVVVEDGREVALGMDLERHRCWSVPDGEELLVMD